MLSKKFDFFLQVNIFLFEPLFEIFDFTKVIPELTIHPFTFEGISEYLRNQLQALHKRLRPVTFCPKGIKTDQANRRSTSHCKREAQVRLNTKQASEFPIVGSLGRQVLQRRKGNDPIGQHLL